jgi:putative hydrolase of the HAD superfamily
MTVEAVTIDAYGTLVTLRDPVPSLQEALAARGVERGADDVEKAFRAEVAYYVPRSYEGRDDATLALLRRDCARVFLEVAGADLAPEEFAPAFVQALVFEAVAGATAACRALADAGLRLAVVANWDVGLHDHLARLGLTAIVDEVVTSADAGAPKPDPAIFRLALQRLDVTAGQAVHIGDSPADEEGARAAGVRFEPAPLADAARRILA